MNKSFFFIALVSLCSLLACNNKPIQVEKYDIIPLPNQMTYAESFLSIRSGLYVDQSATDQGELAGLFNDLILNTGHKGLIVDSTNTATLLALVYAADMPEEHYKLTVEQDKIQIEAASNAGLIYGFQTLLQMIPYGGTSFELKCCEIVDAPRFEYRGMHFDVSRHFFTMDELEEFADKMLHYKLNKLHLHLTDDQGWRLQIEKYPLLTEKGAWRLHDKNDSLCIKRASEDATFALPGDRYETKEGVKMYGGFYTKAEMRDFIQYCSKRNIEIIPEIDIPGHFKAAIDNYPYLSCTDEAGWGEHFSYPACLGKPSTYQFIENVLTEVAELFPSKYIHIGGDEVNKDEWKKCAKCQAAIQKNGLNDEHELQSHFNHHIEAFLATKGKQLMGWDEIVEGGLSKTTTVMWWRNWAPHTLSTAAKNGNDVIVTPDFEYYLDFPYSATPTQKTYDFEPVPEDFTKEMAKSIHGVQANIWTERIPNVDRLYYQALPRMLALAESGWTEKANKNYTSFSTRLASHVDKFHHDKVFYHLPTLTGFDKQHVFMDTAVFEITVPLEDMKVYYTLDGSAPTQTSAQYTGPVEIKETCEVRFRAFKGDVYSKIYESSYALQQCAKPVIRKVKVGLRRQYYKGRFPKSKSVNLEHKANDEAIVTDFGITDFKGKENYALVFTGYYKASSDGVYKFFTTSDDGDQLFINDKLVVDNDGSHGARERDGAVALAAGLHSIRLIYRQIGGGAAQEVRVQAPNEEKRMVQPSELYY